MPNKSNVEILSPAGEFDSLKSAITFGADAVYFADKQFGMRTASRNFAPEEIAEAAEYAHKAGVKAYCTVNIVPSNEEIEELAKYLPMLQEAGIDAAIIADIGLLELTKKVAPGLDIHISTQAGVTNYYTANELHKQGAARVVLARELDLQDIANIKKRVSAELEIEAFIHGAMCMSFSGRCLLGQYFTGRDANHGDCPQVCRWDFKITEAKRDNIEIDIHQDAGGVSIMNAQDLCMIDHIGEVIEAGVTSLKIEGRAKSAYYAGATANAYRAAVDSYLAGEAAPKWALDEVNNVSHRAYSTGFYYAGKMSEGRRTPPMQSYDKGYIRKYKLLGEVIKPQGGNKKEVIIQTRNYFEEGAAAEILAPKTAPQNAKITGIKDSFGNSLKISNQPMKEVTLALSNEISAQVGSFIRMRTA